MMKTLIAMTLLFILNISNVLAGCCPTGSGYCCGSSCQYACGGIQSTDDPTLNDILGSTVSKLSKVDPALERCTKNDLDK